MGRNHVWRYTLCLFHTFAVFENNRKNDAKREAKSRGFCSKNRPWAPQGRLILTFLSIFEDSKNRCLFDAALGRQKIDKIQPGAVPRVPGTNLHSPGRMPGGPPLLWGLDPQGDRA